VRRFHVRDRVNRTRDDFTIETSNKQLNFVQHVVNALKPGGRALMVRRRGGTAFRAVQAASKVKILD